MASVPLPPIGRAFRAGAANHPATATVMAETAARDVINDYPIALFKASRASAHTLNDTTRLMTANHPLVCFRSCSPVAGSVDGTQIAPAERRGLHAYQYLSVTRFWNEKLPLCKLSIS